MNSLDQFDFAIGKIHDYQLNNLKRFGFNITVTSNDRHGVSNYQSIDYLFHALFGLTTNKHQMSVLLSFCEGNPPLTGGFPSQRGH